MKSYRDIIISDNSHHPITQTFPHDGRQLSARRYSNFLCDDMHTFFLMQYTEFDTRPLLSTFKNDASTQSPVNMFFPARRNSTGFYK